MRYELDIKISNNKLRNDMTRFHIEVSKTIYNKFYIKDSVNRGIMNRVNDILVEIGQQIIFNYDMRIQK